MALAFLGSTALLGVGLFLYERRGQTDAAVAAVAPRSRRSTRRSRTRPRSRTSSARTAGLLVAGLSAPRGRRSRSAGESQLVAALGILGALAAPVLVDSGTSTRARVHGDRAHRRRRACSSGSAGVARDRRLPADGAATRVLGVTIGTSSCSRCRCSRSTGSCSSSRRSGTSSAFRRRRCALRRPRCCCSTPRFAAALGWLSDRRRVVPAARPPGCSASPSRISCSEGSASGSG